MDLNSIAVVKKYLRESGIIAQCDEPFIRRLEGGVSSSVWKIALDDQRWVIKQALKKLSVATNWYSDVERIHREHEVMTALGELVPKSAIPKVLHCDYTNHIFMMESAEEGAPTWKDKLLNDKDFNRSVAENAACLLRQIHQDSQKMPGAQKVKFQDQRYFVQLRLDPFHRYLMRQYPLLTSSIQHLIDELTLQKTCLVHGDFSPKNMLVQKNNSIVLIDFEVAHWGNPVFDIAYCLCHLVLKAWFLKQQRELFKLIEVFIAVYDREVSNIIPHMGLLLLARMDGKSPAIYITDENMKNDIRKLAIKWIQDDEQETAPLQKIRLAFHLR